MRSLDKTNQKNQAGKWRGEVENWGGQPSQNFHLTLRSSLKKMASIPRGLSRVGSIPSTSFAYNVKTTSPCHCHNTCSQSPPKRSLTLTSHTWIEMSRIQDLSSTGFKKRDPSKESKVLWWRCSSSGSSLSSLPRYSVLLSIKFLLQPYYHCTSRWYWTSSKRSFCHLRLRSASVTMLLPKKPSVCH